MQIEPAHAFSRSTKGLIALSSEDDDNEPSITPLQLRNARRPHCAPFSDARVFVALPRKLPLVQPFIERSLRRHAEPFSVFDPGDCQPTGTRLRPNLILAIDD